MPSLTATPFHGSPTQKPSMLSTFMLATICGGGIVLIPTFLGSMPVASNQVRNQRSCVPPGKVMANCTCLAAFNLSTAPPIFDNSFVPTRSQNLLDSVIAWPLLFSIMATFMTSPALPPTPLYTEKGILNKQCAADNS